MSRDSDMKEFCYWVTVVWLAEMFFEWRWKRWQKWLNTPEKKSPWPVIIRCLQGIVIICTFGGLAIYAAIQPFFA